MRMVCSRCGYTTNVCLREEGERRGEKSGANGLQSLWIYDERVFDGGRREKRREERNLLLFMPRCLFSCLLRNGRCSEPSREDTEQLGRTERCSYASERHRRLCSRNASCCAGCRSVGIEITHPLRICNAGWLVGGRHAAWRHGGPFGGGARVPTLQGTGHECLSFRGQDAIANSSGIGAGVPTLQKTGHERQPFGPPLADGAALSA